jgi:hypothetical protein
MVAQVTAAQAAIWVREVKPHLISHGRVEGELLAPLERALAEGWQRFLVPIRELATPLARVGLLRIWSPVEDVTLRIGGPRSGKTGELAGRILDAPGAVIATSTRTT